MEKLKILVPLDGTERSMHSINWLKKFFSKDAISITLMNVMEAVLTNEMMVSMPNEIPNGFDYLAEGSKLILNKAIKELEGYEVDKFSILGYAGEEILRKAEKDSYDIIIMTKCSKKGLYRIIGSVTSKVVRNAKMSVTVIPD
ncbi:universal stress protein [Clostridium psychrophilum]|uniref:universal stress protein n=1 Tax=Clostridium psychrophilum TaxID=132926 RepID=UPI001C0CAA92|nr:universal stress protein [Clostridium psychrophilum]MBU3182636.1 universal stress protein [Clostridium psychrophilum]